MQKQDIKELNLVRHTLTLLLPRWCYDHGQETVLVVEILGGQGVVKVIGLKGLTESKDRPSTTYPLEKCIPHFGSVVGVGLRTKSLRKMPEQADGPGRAKAVRNISNFEKILEREGGCWKVTAL